MFPLGDDLSLGYLPRSRSFVTFCCGGFLSVFVHATSQERLDELKDVWSRGDAKIAQLRVVILVPAPERFQGRRRTWYIDNTAALLSLTNGRLLAETLSE